MTGDTSVPEPPPPPPAEPAHDPLIGLLVDQRYRITARLARGGMATVYTAHDERLDRPVALKVMHPHLAESADFVTRFRREARAAARIIHPGVVAVFDQGVVHGQGFLVMELVKGPNLRHLLRTQGTFTVRQALGYVREMLDALGAAHRVGVIHRDMKPENVLVPGEGPVKVVDFGLARAASEVSMSTTGNMLGTVAYMAPEIATTGSADARTDIYSVGIMLYEMLTGDVPWSGDTAMQMAYHHVNDDVPSPSEKVEWLPREIDDLVGSLTARDPADRPSTAHDAVDLVSRVLTAVPAEILDRRADRPDAPANDETLATSRIPVEGGTSPLPLSPTSQTVVRTSTVDELAEPPQEKKRKRGLRALVLGLLLALGFAGGGYWWWAEYGPGSYLTLPNVAGQAQSGATSSLESLGLTVIPTTDFSDTVQSGTVIASNPAAGTRVHKDSDISLIVSKGVDMRTIPDVSGQTKDDAIAALKAEKLAVSDQVEEVWSEDVPEGHVVAVNPEIGAVVPHGTDVSITVSKGREPIDVPDVTGDSREKAESQLKELGLTTSVTEKNSDDVDKGDVISQSIQGGQTAHRGDEIALVVSLGPVLVDIPDVVGKQESDARKTLEDAGFKVKVERLYGGIFGTVRLVEPESGSKAPKGSTVTISVV